jgi:hypothetical protein
MLTAVRQVPGNYQRTEGTQVLKMLLMLPRVQELAGVTVAELFDAV